MLKELNNNNFETDTKNGLKLVEFYATWCGYCRKQELELKEMDKIWIGQVNTDANPELSNGFRVSSLPTFILFNNGIEVERFSGLRSKHELMNIIMKYL